jgi:hypothetical protein
VALALITDKVGLLTTILPLLITVVKEALPNCIWLLASTIAPNPMTVAFVRFAVATSAAAPKALFWQLIFLNQPT